MQEFSTVIASSYDAESLAPMLTEKAADGWSIVSIVSAGTNVIAYLTRGGGTDGSAVDAPAAIVGAADVSTEVADAAADGGVPVSADAGAVDDATITMPAQETAPTADDASATDSTATDADVTPMLTDGDHDESTALTTVGSADIAASGGATGGLAGGVADDVTETVEQLPADQMATAAAPVDETTESPAGDTGAAASTAATDETETTAAAETAATDETETTADSDTPTAAETTAVAETTDDGATDDAATPEPSGVPAGWYADPSGRYELRYWDGAAWTEHVSRAGQQYTDPPVA